MTFDPNIPAASDLISVSQGQLQQNFQSLNTAWNVNHEEFNLANAGKHPFVEFPIQGADPAGALNEFTIFSKTNVAGNNELFYKRDNEANSYQLSGPNPNRATKGSTFLPGGLLLQWGAEATVADNQVYTFDVAFAAAPYSVTITGVRSNTQERSLWVSSGTVTASQFAIRTSSSGVALTPVYWMAIGPGPV
jgi:hypothetical protein